MFRTQKDISPAVDKAKRERGWVTILHPGWSAPTCGKTQYLHFAIRTTFFSHFIFQNIDYTPPCCMECCSRTVMACTCLLVTKRERRDEHLMGSFFGPCLLVQGKKTTRQHYVIRFVFFLSRRRMLHRTKNKYPV